MEMNFCRRCGTRLERVMEMDDIAYRCENGHMLFDAPNPATGIILLDGSDIIMSRRAFDPGKGKIDFFGGFVFPGESFENGARRELAEETGLTDESHSGLEYFGSYTNIYLYQDEPRPVLDVYFVTYIRSGVVIVPADDCAEVVRMSVDAIDWEVISGDSTKAALKDLQTRYEQGFFST